VCERERGEIGWEAEMRQYLYFCTSKASKLSTCGWGGRRERGGEKERERERERKREVAQGLIH
jgi:hypothetical protein